MASAEYHRNWYANNREKQQASSRRCEERRRVDDPLYFAKKIYRERRRTAEKSGIPFSISLEDILPIPSHCPILGIELKSGGWNNPNSPSLDKIKPDLGYVPGNVCWMSFRANRLKYNSSTDEIEKLLTWMREHT